MTTDVLYRVSYKTSLFSLSLTTSSYVMQTAGTGNPLLTALVQYILNVALTLPAILFLDTVSTTSYIPTKDTPGVISVLYPSEPVTLLEIPSLFESDH